MSTEAHCTAAHPPPNKRDPTINTTESFTDNENAERRLSGPGASPAAKLAGAQVRLRTALRQFPDFPSPGILFEDILPIFADPSLHEDLIAALHLHVTSSYGGVKPDVVVGLDARGFLFGPSLALRLGASFVPVRKKGKLPGPCETAGYQKEYGEDFFQMQADAVKAGQKVLVVDDIIATGRSPVLPLHPLLNPRLTHTSQVDRHRQLGHSSSNSADLSSVTYLSSSSISSRVATSSTPQSTRS